MIEALFVGFVAALLRSSAPLLWALVGETLSQRAGVINLGSEGQMLVGAAVAFGVTATTGDPWSGMAAGACAGAVLSLLHVTLCLQFGANQFASGLCVWMVGFGLSALFGASYVGQSIEAFVPLKQHPAPWHAVMPSALLEVTAPTLLSFAVALLAGALVYWTRVGLVLRAVGESAASARAAGIAVTRVRAFWVVVGGALCGIGGAMLSVDTAQTWAEGMSGGRGLVAVGLVIVARWNPLLAIGVALLFGGAEAFSLRLQSAGATVSAHLLHALPYVLSLVVFTLSCMRGTNWAAPRALRAVLTR